MNRRGFVGRLAGLFAGFAALPAIAPAQDATDGLRKVYRLNPLTGKWSRVRMIELAKGNIFRMEVCGVWDTWKATEDASPHESGVAQIVAAPFA